jgi:hypothetical protein
MINLPRNQVAAVEKNNRPLEAGDEVCSTVEKYRINIHIPAVHLKRARPIQSAAAWAALPFPFYPDDEHHTRDHQRNNDDIGYRQAGDHVSSAPIRR